MKNVKTTTAENTIFHELVGDFSQEIWMCSYNDGDVFESVMGKTLNQEFDEAFDGDVCRDRLRKSYPGITDWQQLFEDMLAYHGGWPTGWGVVHTPFKDLAEEYKKIIEDNNRQALYEIPFRYNFDKYEEFTHISLCVPYVDIWDEFRRLVIQRAYKSHQDVYMEMKAKLPEPLVTRIDKEIELKNSIINILFDENDNLINFVIWKP